MKKYNYILALLLILSPSKTLMAGPLSLGQQSFELGRFHTAIEHLTNAKVSIKKRQNKGHEMTGEDADELIICITYLARSYLGKKEYDKSLQCFNEVMGLTDSTDNIAGYYLGVLYFLKGEIGIAQKYWERTIKNGLIIEGTDIDDQYKAYSYLMLHYIKTKYKVNILSENQYIAIINSSALISLLADYYSGKITENTLLSFYDGKEVFYMSILAIALKGKVAGKDDSLRSYIKYLTDKINATMPGFEISNREFVEWLK